MTDNEQLIIKVLAPTSGMSAEQLVKITGFSKTELRVICKQMTMDNLLQLCTNNRYIQCTNLALHWYINNIGPINEEKTNDDKIVDLQQN